MEWQSPAIFRSKTLTNSAAEFVETRARVGLFCDSEGRAPEFANELDRFIRRGLVFDSDKLYEESQKRMESFRRSLARLIRLLKDRNVDSHLDIVIRHPSEPEFTVSYILDIIQKIREDEDNPAKTRACKNFIRRCSQKMQDNKVVIDGLLNMIPNDIYGSVISGGFTVIMAAVERRAEQRETIQTLLAEIPKRLETIQRLSEIHHPSVRLHACADTVIVAICIVLERIIVEITTTWKATIRDSRSKISQRLPFRSRPKGRNPGGDGLDINGVHVQHDSHEQKLPVSDALAMLQEKVEDFQREVDICGQERLGRVEVAAEDMKRGLVDLWKQNQDMNELMTRNFEELGVFLQPIMDAVYRFCASHPNFNTKTGGVTLLHHEHAAVSKPRSWQESNIRLTSKWLRELKNFPYSSREDTNDCLDHVELLSPGDKDIAQSTLDSQELRNWLQRDTSAILDIGLHTPPDSLQNPLSFTSAVVGTTLRSTGHFPVLAFFCAHRSIETLSEDKAGATALVRSLNAQLLGFISDQRPSVDLSALGIREKTNLKEGLSLLETLLSSLSDDDTVFIVIDSLSRLAGRDPEEDGDKVIKKLRRIIERNDDLAIKIMVTDALVGSFANTVADLSLHVSDWVNGRGVIDIDVSSGGDCWKTESAKWNKERRVEM